VIPAKSICRNDTNCPRTSQAKKKTKNKKTKINASRHPQHEHGFLKQTPDEWARTNIANELRTAIRRRLGLSSNAPSASAASPPSL
jgi:hypothetical protein